MITHIKSLRMVLAAALLTIVLSFTAFAGQMDGVGIAEPPPSDTTSTTAPAEDPALTNLWTAICEVIINLLP